jgi:hypothetical protein
MQTLRLHMRTSVFDQSQAGTLNRWKNNASPLM